MITKFKIFEQHENIDPYNEDDWNDYKFIDATLDNIKVGDILYSKYHYISEIEKLIIKRIDKRTIHCYDFIIGRNEGIPKNMFNEFEFKKKEKI